MQTRAYPPNHSHDEADSPENRQRIDKADGVLFTGGDQTTLVDKLLDTSLLARIHERYFTNDFVIGGHERRGSRHA